MNARTHSMKILLVQAITYFPAFGGANKSYRLLLEALARKGHSCRLLAPTENNFQPSLSRQDVANAMNAAGMPLQRGDAVHDVTRVNQVDVHLVWEAMMLPRHFLTQLRLFDPTWVLLGSEDSSYTLLRAAAAARPERVIYLAPAAMTLPFGPASACPDATKIPLLRKLAGIVTAAPSVRDYIRHWSGLTATLEPFRLYEEGPYPNFGSPDRGFVTLVNPCALKGVSLFLALADAMPAVAFAAVPTWGTTPADLAALQARRNITLFPASRDIDAILSCTRVLLAPSVWHEAFGRIVVETMARGIPVIASNVGGLPDAKLGVDYVLPVNPIESYEDRLDANNLPVPIVPDQPMAIWRDTLHQLLADRTEYERISRASRAAALAYIAGMTIDPFERYLQRLASARPALNAFVGES